MLKSLNLNILLRMEDMERWGLEGKIYFGELEIIGVVNMKLKEIDLWYWRIFFMWRNCNIY